jgi:SAM-dependent methyltransferase
VSERDLGWFSGGDAYERYIGRWSRPVADLFLGWLDQPVGLRWVDVGCGTGALTAELLRRASPTSVVGVEPSEAFLRQARASLPHDRAAFLLGDAQDLPLAARRADTIVSGLVLNFVPDPRRALGEMLRVIAPGGTIAAYVWDYGGEMQMLGFFWRAVVDLFPDDAGFVEAERFPLCEPGALEELFVTSGLEAVEVRALDAPTPFADFEDYWSPFLLGQGPAGAFCASLSERDRERLGRHLEANLPIGPTGTIDLVARAWSVRGRAPAP